MGQGGPGRCGTQWGYSVSSQSQRSVASLTPAVDRLHLGLACKPCLENLCPLAAHSALDTGLPSDHPDGAKRHLPKAYLSEM